MKKVISKWAKKPFQQVVIITENGKKKNGKTAYTSTTKHELIK